MIFYHYTALECLPSIKAGGLTMGELPLSEWKAINVVWLTVDPSPAGHGLSEDRALTDWECLDAGVPKGTRWANKRAVRITVRLPKAKVKRWLPWARKRMEPRWLNTLVSTGGGMAKAKTWYISFDPISPDAFHSIDLLCPKKKAV